MKKSTIKLLVLFLVTLSAFPNLQAQWTGAGTLVSPYQISTEADLVALRTAVNKYPPPNYTEGGNQFVGVYFKLMNDLTLSGAWIPIGNNGHNQFRGNFDGNGKTIRGLNVNNVFAGALFRRVGPGATISNLTIDGAVITGSGVNGVLIGNCATGGTIRVTNCHVTNSTVTPTGNGIYQMGGMIGQILGELIMENSSVSNVSVSGEGHIGGVVGRIGDNSNISTASLDHVVVTNTSVSGAGSYIGGIIGQMVGDVTINNSRNIGDGTKSITGDGSIGGLIGYAVGDCIATGDTVSGVPVTGSGYAVGGVFGYIKGKATFTDILQENGDVTSTGDDAVGGIAGVAGAWGGIYADDDPQIEEIGFFNCSSTGSLISGQESVGGLAGMIHGHLKARNCYSNNSINGTLNSTCQLDAGRHYYAGGLFANGYKNIDIEDALHEDGDITGCEIVGGIVGGTQGAVIRIVNARKIGGEVYAMSNFSSRVGSIIGKTEGVSELVDCYGEAVVKTNLTGGRYAGGIIGTVFGSTTLRNCRFKGTVEGWNYIGGLIGSIGRVDSYIIRPRDSLMVGDVEIYVTNALPSVESQYIGGTDAVGGLVGSVGVYLTAEQEIEFAGQNVGTLTFSGNLSTTTASCDTIEGRKDIGGFVGLVNGTVNINNATIVAPISATLENAGGLCGYVSGETTISNSTHSGSLTQTGPVDNVGGIAGTIDDKLTLTNVKHISGNISGKDYIGGLVGNVGGLLNVTGSTVGVSGSNITITGAAQVGGFAGYVNGVTTIGTSTSYSNIAISGNNGGGLCGNVMQKATITQSTHIGTVIGDDMASDNIGGVAGNIGGELTLDRTTHSGNVTGQNNVGGLVGNVGSTCNITGVSTGNTVSATEITGKGYVGGLVGRVAGATTIKTANSMANINLGGSGQHGGGLCGYIDGYTEISNTTHIGTVIGASNLGGVVGTINEDFKVDEVRHEGNITGGSYIGGFGGHIVKGVTFVNTSSSTATVSSSGNNAGGLFGWIEGECHIRDNSTFYGKVAGTEYVGGFIGLAGGPTTVSNVIQAADSITGAQYIGGFIGGVTKLTTIDSAYIIGNLKATGSNIGGMVGYHSGENLTIKRSYYEGNSIVGAGAIGGFVGLAGSSGVTTIDSCYTHIKTITGTAANVGGLVGRSAAGNTLNIKNSFSDGDRMVGKGTITGTNYVGGLVGVIQNGNSSITSSFNRSHVNGTASLGGLVGGVSANFSITHSYNTANVTGTGAYVGGILGARTGGTVTLNKLYNIGMVSGSGNVGAITGSASTPTYTNCYTVHCVVEDGSPTGYNGTTVRADVMSSASFANTTLGSPFRYVVNSLPKLPMTNHLFVGVVSDTTLSNPIRCAYDVSIGQNWSQTFNNPIRRLTDNGTRIFNTTYDKTNPNNFKTYSLSTLTVDHLIVPVFGTYNQGTITPAEALCELSNGSFG